MPGDVLFQAESFESLVMGPSKLIYLSMEQVCSTGFISENKDVWRGWAFIEFCGRISILCFEEIMEERLLARGNFDDTREAIAKR